jgi:carbohydrate kinase (thermoresistant glucokinase family)
MNRIIYIMGVAASGKTTVGELLSVKMDIPFFDADDFHSAANKEKMTAGIPLNDEDRKGWLQKLNALALVQAELKGGIIACSALKDKYRDILQKGIVNIEWIFLQATYDMIYERMKKRTGHYMPSVLLTSQFESLEIPVNAFTVSINKKPEEISEIIFRYLEERQKDSI